jgi:predicted small metal-binding protein
MSRQTAFVSWHPQQRRPSRRCELEKQIECPCGQVLRGKNDDEVVKRAQEHAKRDHNMEMTREQALSMARPA